MGRRFATFQGAPSPVRYGEARSTREIVSPELWSQSPEPAETPAGFLLQSRRNASGFLRRDFQADFEAFAAHVRPGSAKNPGRSGSSLGRSGGCAALLFVPVRFYKALRNSDSEELAKGAPQLPLRRGGPSRSSPFPASCRVGCFVGRLRP